MTEWLKVADCKSVRIFPTVGSNPTSFNKNIFPSRNITQSGSVSVLGTGSHVFKSHYFDFLATNLSNEPLMNLFKDLFNIIILLR